jgi:beta-lactamase superfamily II metal-dependent hydrolase
MLAICLMAEPITQEESYYALWNVGQGQWFTWVQTHSCLHVDMGGEKHMPRAPSTNCRGKKNTIVLTHFDWDHIRWAVQFQNLQTPSSTCWLKLKHQSLPAKKAWYLNQLHPCKHEIKPELIQWAHLDRPQLSSNDAGTIYLINSEVLIPGDQSSDYETEWLPKFKSHLVNVRLLIVPHHGSKSSSGKSLIQSLPLAKAWASARKKRYGHPHTDVLKRYKASGKPLLSTEQWGHLKMPAKFRQAF